MGGWLRRQNAQPSRPRLAEQAERDAARTAWFELRGYRVIRFWNNEVLANIEGVVLEIRSVLAQQSAAAHPTPNPSPSRGGAMPLPHRDAGGKD